MEHLLKTRVLCSGEEDTYLGIDTRQHFFEPFALPWDMVESARTVRLDLGDDEQEYTQIIGITRSYIIDERLEEFSQRWEEYLGSQIFSEDFFFGAEGFEADA